MAYAVRKRGIPDGARHHEPAECKERRSDFQHLAVAAVFEVSAPKPPEQRLEATFEAATPLKRKEEIVQRQRGHIVSGITEFAARTIQERKVRS